MLINGVNYHIETHGAGEALILLHGFSGSSANWQAHAAVFARQFRVVTTDLLGHGRTESPADPARFRIDAAAQDLIVLLDALETPAVDLLGYSMGGRLALYLALTYPVRVKRLILESASPGLRTAAERQQRVEQDEALAQRIEIKGIPDFAEYWSNLPLFASQPPDLRATLHRQRLQNNPTGLANSLRGMGAGGQPSLWERLGNVAMPTLLIAGALDEKFVTINRDMDALIPDATFSIIPDAGHTVHAEQPVAYRDSVLQFLNASA